MPYQCEVQQCKNGIVNCKIWWDLPWKVSDPKGWREGSFTKVGEIQGPVQGALRLAWVIICLHTVFDYFCRIGL